MKKYILLSVLCLSILCFFGCTSENNNNVTIETTTSEATTEKVPGKYADSEFLGSWYNAGSEELLVCKLNDDGSAIFKENKNAKWEETQTGLTITTTANGETVTMEGYFVIVGDGYAARATEANMHYLDEGGELQLEIMLTETTCVDCIKK